MPRVSAVRLLPNSGTRAILAIDGPAAATWNTIVEEVEEGSGGLVPTLAAVADGTWVPNVGTLTLGGVPLADETVTIGTTVYTWKAATTTGAFEVKIGASASISADNLIAAINLGAGSGSLYGSLTTIHPTVRAFAGAGDTVDVHTKSNTTLTAVGTLIATTSTTTAGTWGAATLADGTDGTNVTFITTANAIVCHFASGYSTVSDFEAALAADASASALIRVKTAGTTPLYLLVVADDDFAATALTGASVASNAAPTLSSVTGGKQKPFPSDEAKILLRSVAGSGTMTATGILWGWSVATSYWYVAKLLNGGNAIAETTADGINYSETVTGLGAFSHLWLQLATGGTAPEVEGWADFVEPGAYS